MTDNISQKVTLSKEAEARIEALKVRYPKSKSAIMPALYIAQEELGWLTDKAFAWVSSRLDLPPAHVVQVATFYTMYYKKPVGKYHFQICRTLSCMLCGSRKITKHIKEKFGLKAGEISKCGMWSYEEVECLGSCGTAPMAEINDVYFENLTPEKLDKIVSQIEKDQPDLRYSAVREELGAGMPAQPRSEVWPPQDFSK